LTQEEVSEASKHSALLFHQYFGVLLVSEIVNFVGELQLDISFYCLKKGLIFATGDSVLADGGRLSTLC